MSDAYLAGEVKKELEAFTDPAVKALLAERLSSAINIEIDRASGLDVSLGEQALRASLASIAYEQQVKFELAAARLAAKSLVFALKALQ